LPALDGNQCSLKDKPERVCGNTALFMPPGPDCPWHFVNGSFEQHFGLFEHCTAKSPEQSRDSREDRAAEKSGGH
jgi:hypothetical protein